jgi:hypothetical protein
MLAGAIHGYIVTFWVAAAILVGSAVVCALVLAPGVLTFAAGDAPSSVSERR